MHRSVTDLMVSYKEQDWYPVAREFILYSENGNYGRTFNECFRPSSGRAEDHLWYQNEDKKRQYSNFFRLLEQDDARFLPVEVCKHLCLIVPNVLQAAGDYSNSLIAWYIGLIQLMKPAYHLLLNDEAILSSINGRFSEADSGELKKFIFTLELTLSMDLLIEGRLREILIRHYQLNPDQHACVGQQITSFFNATIGMYKQQLEDLSPQDVSALNLKQSNLSALWDLYEEALSQCLNRRMKHQDDAALGNQPALFEQFDQIIQSNINTTTIIFEHDLLEMLSHEKSISVDSIVTQARDFFRHQLSAPFNQNDLDAIDVVGSLEGLWRLYDYAALADNRSLLDKVVLRIEHISCRLNVISEINGLFRLYRYAHFAKNQSMLQRVVMRMGVLPCADEFAMSLYEGGELLGLNDFIGEMLIVHDPTYLQHFFSRFDDRLKQRPSDMSSVFRVRCRVELYLLQRASGCLSYTEFQNRASFFKRDYRNVKTAFKLLDLLRVFFEVGAREFGLLFESVRGWMEEAQSYGIRGRSLLNQSLQEILPDGQSPTLQV